MTVAGLERIDYNHGMKRETHTTNYPELELSLKLSQLEGTLRFLNYMNTGKTVTGEDFPRNITERSSVDRALKRIQECRAVFKVIINKHKIKHDPVPAVQIAKL